MCFSGTGGPENPPRTHIVRSNPDGVIHIDALQVLLLKDIWGLISYGVQVLGSSITIRFVTVGTVCPGLL